MADRSSDASATPQRRVSRETRAGLVREVLLQLGLAEDLVSPLVIFSGLLRDVAVPRGFVAEGDADRLFERHVADSLRATAVLNYDDLRVADVGSGAGLPGIPLAIVRPSTTFVLIEPKRARGAFVELAVERLGLLNVELRLSPVEAVAEQGTFDGVLARAFAPVERAWNVASRLLRPGGRMVLFAGEEAVVPQELPGATSVRSEAGGLPMLESGGPLIIITR